MGAEMETARGSAPSLRLRFALQEGNLESRLVDVYSQAHHSGGHAPRSLAFMDAMAFRLAASASGSSYGWPEYCGLISLRTPDPGLSPLRTLALRITGLSPITLAHYAGLSPLRSPHGSL